MDALHAVARRVYGMAGALHPLASERDQNARLDTTTGRFVLKLINAGEDAALIGLQDATLRHLGQVAGIPRLVPTLGGADHGAEGACLVRLVTWADGVTLSAAPRSLTQLRNLGAFMGRVTRGLQGFGHPAAIRADFPWSLDHVSALKADVAGDARRALLQGLFDRYEARVLPVQLGLRAQVLHQDANDNNVIVNPDDPDQITGLIDFGDMCYGRTVNELAITLAYALLDAPDLYAAARALIAGYVAEFPLLEGEADQLYDLMRMRLVCSLCISSRQSRLHPDNAYLLISQAPAFALLERLDRIDPEFMVALFRRAAGFAATKAVAPLRAYLVQAQVAQVFQPPLASAARIALLTNGEQPGMPAFSDRGFDAWFAAQRPTARPASVAFYGLGAYAEQRSVYATDQFSDAASTERRTRHTGIDVFCAAGTAVHAPLAGGVPFYTLYGHLGASLPGLCKVGQTVEAGDLIAHLGDWHENGGWAAHLHFQIMSDILAQTNGNFFGAGHASLWDVWSDICPDPNLIMRLAEESFTVDPQPPAALMPRRARAIGPSLSLSYTQP